MEENERHRYNPFIRNHYYPGKLLHAEDFVNEQKYYNGKLQFINHKFHGCGIIDGLEIQVNGDNRLELKAGSALDGQGRIIIVPGDRILEIEDIEGLELSGEEEFVLGISYAEKSVEQERCVFHEEEKYHTARILETFALRAYRLEEKPFQEHTLRDISNGLTRRHILYENETIRLILEIPCLVPSDSIFRIRLQAAALSGQKTAIGWRMTAGLQGGRFLESGRRHQILEGREAVLEGNLQQEWDVYTDEKRLLPIVLELGGLEVMQDGYRQTISENFQFYIDTSEEYRKALRDFGIKGGNLRKYCGIADSKWLPLSHLRVVKQQEDRFSVQKINDKEIRFFVRNLREDEMLLEMMEENGIVDIRWRYLLKAGFPWSAAPEPPFAPVPKPSLEPVPGLPIDPAPDSPAAPIPKPPVPDSPHSKRPPEIPEIPGPWSPEEISMWNRQKEWMGKLLEAEREKHVRRGVAVIPIPKRYRRGQALYSEEISYGFPGEEVLLWCGRVWEEHNYAYWERDKAKYSVIHGAENLFPKQQGSGWRINEQAIYQDVDKGTFQIAITLLKGRRRNREKEVAVSWVACRIM